MAVPAGRAPVDEPVDEVVLERGRSVHRVRVDERVVRGRRARSRSLMRPGRPCRRHTGPAGGRPVAGTVIGVDRRRDGCVAAADRMQRRAGEPILGPVVLVAPHAPDVVEHRRPQLPEGVGHEVAVRARVDRRRCQAGRLVGLERQQVELETRSTPSPKRGSRSSKSTSSYQYVVAKAMSSTP